MAEIEFNEERYLATRNTFSKPTSSGLTGWFAEKALRLGIIRNESQADYILLGTAILMISISLYLFFGGSIHKSGIDPRNTSDITTMKESANRAIKGR